MNTPATLSLLIDTGQLVLAALAILAVMVGPFVVAGLVVRAVRLTRRGHPEHCASCGRRLIPEELEHYGRSCEACEEKFLDRFDHQG